MSNSDVGVWPVDQRVVDRIRVDLEDSGLTGAILDDAGAAVVWTRHHVALLAQVLGGFIDGVADEAMVARALARAEKMLALVDGPFGQPSARSVLPSSGCVAIDPAR